MKTEITRLDGLQWKSVKDGLPPIGKLILIRWEQQNFTGNANCPDGGCFAILTMYGESMVNWKIGVDRYMQTRLTDEWSLV